MKKRRSKNEIKKEVLSILKNDGPHTITQIMNCCLLCYKKTQDVLSDLVEEEQIETFYGSCSNNRQCVYYKLVNVEHVEKNNVWKCEKCGGLLVHRAGSNNWECHNPECYVYAHTLRKTKRNGVISFELDYITYVAAL